MAATAVVNRRARVVDDDRMSSGEIRTIALLDLLMYRYIPLIQEFTKCIAGRRMWKQSSKPKFCTTRTGKKLAVGILMQVSSDVILLVVV